MFRKEISIKFAQSETLENTNSDIAKALKYAAYAREEDVKSLSALISKNPELLLQRGNVKTPGGDEIQNVTPYEFLLGAGDYELAAIVQVYFEKIEKGEAERINQYNRYKPHINNMLNQKPYQLFSIDLIMHAQSEEIEALLKNDLTGNTELCKAILQFRKDWAPRIISEPCMHYNYASLRSILLQAWSSWYKLENLIIDENQFNKLKFFWELLIEFEMRRLPGIDRCVVAQGLQEVENLVSMDRKRSYVIKKHGKEQQTTFPITDSDDSINGLGVNFAFDACYNIPSAAKAHMFLTQYVEEKKSGLEMLYQKAECKKHILNNSSFFQQKPVNKTIKNTQPQLELLNDFENFNFF